MEFPTILQLANLCLHKQDFCTRPFRIPYLLLLTIIKGRIEQILNYLLNICSCTVVRRVVIKSVTPSKVMILYCMYVERTQPLFEYILLQQTILHVKCTKKWVSSLSNYKVDIMSVVQWVTYLQCHQSSGVLVVLLRKLMRDGNVAQWFFNKGHNGAPDIFLRICWLARKSQWWCSSAYTTRQ